MILIKTNPENKTATAEKIAKIIMIETGATSLLAVESFASMICNICKKTSRQFSDISNDTDLFNKNYDNVDTNSREYAMCIRVARKMMNGDLSDNIRGAIRWHNNKQNPKWAKNIGWVAVADNLFFYTGC